MELYPAIDIREGRAVRLRQGDFAQETVYADDPLAAAERWVAAGARRLHVVDLDGARQGRPAALDHLRRIAGTLGLPLQFGGGLRTQAAIAAALGAGADRVVLGTAAQRDPDLLRAALEEHGARVAVAVDVRGGRVSTAAWTHTSGEEGTAMVARLAAEGVETIVYTDVDRDGMLEGPALAQVSQVADAARPARLVYSGGIGDLSHLRALAALGHDALTGVIVGKALYEQRFTVAEAQAALEDPYDRPPDGSA